MLTDILLRMYLRWAEGKGFTTDILDLQPGDEAGVKSVTIMVKGPVSYYYATFWYLQELLINENSLSLYLSL